MLRPQSGCRTFMVLDRIRVPLPAARTMTAVAPGRWFTELLLLAGGPGVTVAPRVGVEPTSLSPHSKCGGPCRQTNRGWRSQTTHSGPAPSAGHDQDPAGPQQRGTRGRGVGSAQREPELLLEL